MNVRAGAATQRLAAILLAVLPAACATHGERFGPIEGALTASGPEAALARLDQHSRTANSVPLYLLEEGMLLHMAGEYEQSNTHLAEARDRMDALDPFSFSESVASVTIGEGLRSYVGPPFERITLHVVRAFNFIALDDWDGARVEALQIDRRLNAMRGSGFYRDDPFARYVSGIIFEQLGERSDALIAYRKAYETYVAQQRTTGVAPPRPLRAALLRLTAVLGEHEEFAYYQARFGIDPDAGVVSAGDVGHVVVFLGNGLAPRKREAAINAQHPQTGRLYRVAVPRYGSRRTALTGAALEIPGQGEVESETAYSLDRVARETLDERMPGIIARAAVRAAAKDRMVDQAHAEDPLAGFLVNIATFGTERADDRAWTTLPGEYMVLEKAVEPGRHDLHLRLRGSHGRIWTGEIPAVKVGAGERRFLFARSLSSRVPFHHSSPPGRE